MSEKLVVTGDFFQLPPVTKSGKEPFFTFQSEAWKTCIEHTVTLTQVFRQKESRKSSATRSNRAALNRVITRLR